MKRTPIKQVGKIGKLNQKANRKINQMWIDKDIMWCELDEPHNCNQSMGHTNAHRRKRDWYKGKPEHLLYSYNHVIKVCSNGHDLIEYDKAKTEEVFLRLRGEELIY